MRTTKAWIVNTLAAGLIVTTASAADASRKLTLLHTSDEHSRLLAVGPESEDHAATGASGDLIYLKGGVARRSTVLKELRARAIAAGAGVLTLASGDELMGTLAHVADPANGVDYLALKQLGYDAVTFGNHDFEVGPDFTAQTLAAALANAPGGNLFPILASNIKWNGESNLFRFFDEGTAYNPAKPIRRWHVVSAQNGLRVGLVGIMGINASHYAPGKAPIEFSCNATAEQNPAQLQVCLSALYSDTQAQVNAVRAQGVDLVVVLGHLGLDSNPNNLGESDLVATNVTGIDVILSGHSHLLVPSKTVRNQATGKSVIVAEPGGFGLYVNQLTLAVAADGSVSLDPSGSYFVPVTGAIAPDPALKPLVDSAITHLELDDDGSGKGPFVARSLGEILPTPPAWTHVGDWYFAELGKTTFDVLQATKAQEMPMLRLVADAFLSAANDQVGWIQTNFPSVTRVDLALAASGYTRDSLWKGREGNISFADVFRVLPLGRSPLDGTLGHPLVAVGLQPADLLALLTLTPLSHLAEDYVDYFTTAAGLCVTYDPALMASMPVLRIVKSDATNCDHCTGDVLFDLSYNGQQSTPDWRATGYFNPAYATTTFVTAIDYYHLVAFPLLMANDPSGRVKLRAPDGTVVTDANRNTLLPKMILHYPDGNELKSFEALAKYIAQQTNGLPQVYADSTPSRMFCTGPLCGQSGGAATAPGVMTLTLFADQISVYWTGQGILQASSTLGATAVWTDLGLAKPYVTTRSARQVFYRVKGQ